MNSYTILFNKLSMLWYRFWRESYPANMSMTATVSVLVLLSAALFTLYYLLRVVNMPRVIGGGTKLRKHILSYCPILSQYYYPTPWAFNRHLSTIVRALLQRCPQVSYDRLIIIISLLLLLLSLSLSLSSLYTHINL